MNKSEVRSLTLGSYRDVGRSGIVLGSDGITRTSEVSALIDSIIARKRRGLHVPRMIVLTGTHGTPDGDLVDEREFYLDDKLKELSYLTAVDVGPSLASRSWQRYLGQHKSLIILAWCYSARWRGLRRYVD